MLEINEEIQISDLENTFFFLLFISGSYFPPEERFSQGRDAQKVSREGYLMLIFHGCVI